MSLPSVSTAVYGVNRGLTGWVDGRKRGMKVVTSVPTEMTTTAARAKSTGFSYRLLKFIRCSP